MTVSHPQDAVDQRDAEVGAALRVPAGRRILLAGGTVLTLDPAIGNLLGDVLIEDGRITAVGVDLKARAGEHAIVVDARHAIVMPGLIDSHLHAWLGQLRGISQGLDFPGYMQLVHREVAPHYRPEDMYTGNLIAALMALDGGVTTILDNSHNARSLDHMTAAVQGLADAKIRAVHATAPPVDGSVPEPAWLTAVERLRERHFSSEDQLLTMRLMDLAPTERLWRYARDEDLWVTTEMGAHVTNLGDLAAAGLLTEKHTFNHCLALPGDDWKRIGGAGATVNLCTRSDTHFGLGQMIPPVDQALKAKITPGLSTDNETTYVSDMLTEMQHLVTVHRGHTFGRLAAGEQATQLMPRQVLEFSTLGGAANCGLSHVTGSLTPGKQADVVLLRTTDVNTSLATNAFTTVVGFANRGNVDAVFVGGRIRKWRGRLVGHDLAGVLERAAASRTYLMERVGLTPDRF
ncbi:amidohydrolase family protein [Actinocrispum sp. NPDC049592]|uniref:amidohydrolase family protein n=1 Tax=Actinocrispum sp. NPDC049592 TaxID=3154835 RepID=UPI00341E6D2B